MSDDGALLRAWVHEQDSEALVTLFQRYVRLVFAECFRLTRSRADAEDITQECFLEFAQRAGSIRGSVGTWLHVLGRSRALDTLRRHKTRKKHEANAVAVNGTSNEAKFPEIGRLVDDVVGQLPEELRAPLIMHYLAGRTQAEVATELGVDQATVSRRLRKGVERLHEKMKRSGVVVTMALLLMFLKEKAVIAAPATLMANLGKIALACAAQHPACLAAEPAEIAVRPPSTARAAASSSILKTMAISAGAVALALLAVWFVFAGLRPGISQSGTGPATQPTSQQKTRRAPPTNTSEGEDAAGQHGGTPGMPKATMTVAEPTSPAEPPLDRNPALAVDGEHAQPDLFAADPSFIQADRRDGRAMEKARRDRLAGEHH